MAAAWLERVRRTTPWRCWVRGMQVLFAGAAVIGAAIGLNALGTPTALASTAALAGFGIALVGFGPAFVSMVVLLARNHQMFNAHSSTSVAAALGRDLFRLHAPPPFAEPPGPPPQWRPHGKQDTPVDAGDSSGAHDGSASGG